MTEDQEFTLFPEMVMLPTLVKKPEAHLVAPDKPIGAISIGAQYAPGYGPLLFIGMHHEDGEVLISALNAERFNELMATLVQISERIAAGAFDQPRQTQ